MIKKTIYISRPCHLSLRNCQLVVSFKDDDSEKTVPIEDIGYVILENSRISLTAPLVAALSENNSAVVFCDSHQMPAALTLCLEGNKTQQETIRNQIEASVPATKNIWKQLIVAKIKNQAALLRKLGKNGGRLDILANNVKSGDSDNREGIAARIYWQELFGSDFTRDREGPAPNNMLNYGYSILRGAVARALAGSGLYTGLGVFHRNRYNAFPLADDVMEPFRPFVDEIVFELYNNGENDLTHDVKGHLLGLLTCDTIYDGQIKPLSVGLSTTSASLAKYYSGEVSKLVLPSIV